MKLRCVERASCHLVGEYFSLIDSVGQSSGNSLSAQAGLWRLSLGDQCLRRLPSGGGVVKGHRAHVRNPKFDPSQICIGMTAGSSVMTLGSRRT